METVFNHATWIKILAVFEAEKEIPSFM